VTAADEAAPAAERDDRDIVLSDPRAIRALAHPARIVVLERLFSGAVLTATECAQLAGLTPSAMSYHLRALERYGLVGRAAASGDGRERPWRALGSRLRVDAATSLAGQAAEAVLLSSLVERLRGDLDNALTQRADVPAELRKSTTFSLTPVDLTSDEARQLNEAVDALIERFRDRPRPAAALPYHLWWAAIPVENP
jgi:DNA-binding transcriptional ArsR family regulator